MDRLILASSSPRRTQLLEEAGYLHHAVAPNVDESLREGEPAYDYALRIAREKSSAVTEVGAVTLGADTVVVHDGRALGKPLNAGHAVEVLEALGGGSHEVMTGWAIAGPDGVIASDVEVTQVLFRELTREEIQTYVATGEPMDRAGAYAIQGGASGFVTRLEGSYSNVMGLPMEAVIVALGAAGIHPTDMPAP